MLQPKSKKSTKSTKSYPEGPAGSYLPGLPASVVADQARTMKASAGGPRYKILKDGSGISTVTRTPLQQKAIVEKGSREKGKVEKYASKAAMKKHEKKETEQFEKKEMKKSPLKQTTGPGTKPKDSTNIEKTTDYSRNQKNTINSIKNSKGVYGNTTKNPKTGMQEADPYEKKYVKGKNKYQGDSVINTKTGKTEQASSTYSGSSNKRGMPGYYDKAQAKTKSDLYEGYKKDSTMRMASRNKFANYTNIRTGAKQNLTEADKQDLVQYGYAKKTPLKQVSALSGKKDKSTVAPKTVASGAAKRTPILMKKKC